jgi:4-aminobutyrate aminotransferase-like enzyme
LHAALSRDPSRQGILASRHGFHGKKGVAWAASGSEADAERDPRVRFFDFPREECRDLSMRGTSFDVNRYDEQWESLLRDHGDTFAAVITEPYLGGGGSYHPPAEYLQALQSFCRRHDILFILDEVQSNFGRTGEMFAFEKYGLEPDIVVLGKGLGNGVPVAAAVGPRAVFDLPGYGEMSDTWSANPLSCAAVVATLEEFAARDVLGPMRESSTVIESGLVALKQFPFVAHVRGEEGGMVWGVETADWAGVPAADWANRLVLEAYRGAGGPADDGVHLLGPLSKKVVRISPPLVITPEQARESLAVLHAACDRLAAEVPR